MTFRLFRQLVRISFQQDLAYRTSIFFAFIGTLLWMGVFIGTYAVIYTQVDSLTGYSFDEAMIYYAIYSLLAQLLYALFQRSLTGLPQMIHTGELDTVLTKPADPQLYLSLRRISLLDLTKTLPPLVLLIIFLSRNPQFFHWGFIPLFILAALGAYALWFFVVSLSFFASQLSMLSELFITSMSMLQFPARIYEGATAAFLFVIFPLASVVSLPVASLLETPGPVVILIGIALVACLLLASRLFWRFGFSRYSSAT